MRAFLDLALPVECGGCSRPDVAWCAGCARALGEGIRRVVPRSDPGVPCWALGGYTGPRRRAVLAAKEQNRRDLAVPLGAGLSKALRQLRAAGEFDPAELAPLVLVPAPTRARAARSRGGDPVTRFAEVAAARTARTRVVPLLSLRHGVRDSVGLSASARLANLSGRVRVRDGVLAEMPAGANVVLVDDVLTTGATIGESVRALWRHGVVVTGAVVIAAA